MQRPWIEPLDVKNYTSNDKVKNRDDSKITYDIARAESYVIFKTNNRFEDCEPIPDDVKIALIMLAEAYAKQAIKQVDGIMKSETFDDYSYSLDTDTDLADTLGLGAMLEPYIISKKGKIEMKLRRL